MEIVDVPSIRKRPFIFPCNINCRTCIASKGIGRGDCPGPVTRSKVGIDGRPRPQVLCAGGGVIESVLYIRTRKVIQLIKADVDRSSGRDCD